MNEFIENHERYSLAEFMNLVNAKLAVHPGVPPITEDEACFYLEHDLGIGTVVEEHVYFHEHHERPRA